MFILQIERAEEDGTVVFQDGTRVKADAIVHCTGYVIYLQYISNSADVAGVYAALMKMTILCSSLDTSTASRSWPTATRLLLPVSVWTTTAWARCTSMCSRHNWLLTSPSSH